MSHMHVGGKLTPRRDPRLLQLASYLQPDLEPVPELDLTGRVPAWGMYGNDKKGDCTFAAAAHMIELWTEIAGKEAVPSVSTIVRAYNKMSPDDQGCVEEDVLSLWRHTGIGGHKIDAYAAIDVKSERQMKLATQLFGGAYLGIALPLTAQDQVGQVWDYVPSAPAAKRKPGSWGGHAVNKAGFNAQGFWVITWGKKQFVTWRFWEAYGDEAYAILPHDWAKVPGIDYAKLQGELPSVGKVAA